MINVIWAPSALEMADRVLEYTEEQFGKRQKKKLQKIFAHVASEIAVMPKIHQKEPALIYSEYDFRYYLIFDRIKVIFQIVDDNNITIVAVVTTYRSNGTIIALTKNR